MAGRKKRDAAAARIKPTDLQMAVVGGLAAMKEGLPLDPLSPESTLKNILQPLLDKLERKLVQPLNSLVEASRGEAGQEAQSGPTALDAAVDHLIQLPQLLEEQVKTSIRRVKDLELHSEVKAAEHLKAYFFLVLVYNVSHSGGGGAARTAAARQHRMQLAASRCKSWCTSSIQCSAGWLLMASPPCLHVCMQKKAWDVDRCIHFSQCACCQDMGYTLPTHLKGQKLEKSMADAAEKKWGSPHFKGFVQAAMAGKRLKGGRRKHWWLRAWPAGLSAHAHSQSLCSWLLKWPLLT